MELERLQIDRERSRRGRSGRGKSVGRVVLLAALALLVWLFWKPISAFVDRVRLPEVQVVRVVPTSALAASAVSGTSANGYVVARTRAALSADTPGRIVEMNVIEGSIVKKGDVVARLYSDEYTAALHRAEADLAAGKTTVERSKRELEVAGADLDTAHASQAEAEADLARLQADVQATEASLREAGARTTLAGLEHDRATQLLGDGFDTQESVDRAKSELDQARAGEEAARATLDAAGQARAVGKARVESARVGVEAAERRQAVQGARVEEAQAQLGVLAATRDQAAATLDKTNVRAPFDGVVVLKDAEVGEVVSPNAQGGQSRGSVVTMVDLATLEVQVELPETSLSAAKIGETAFIYLDAFPEDRYVGKVDRIWPTANRQKATVEVRVTFDAPDERLRPEMGARIVFAPREPEAGAPAGGSLFVPGSAVVRRDGKSVLFVVDGERVHAREVGLGETLGERVQVEKGLEGGESVVVDPPADLSDGDRVRISG